MEDNSTVLDTHAADNEAPAVAIAGKADPEYVASDDGNQVKRGDKTYVRQEALHAERERAAGYAKTLQTLEPLMPEFEQFLAQKRAGGRATVDRATRSATDDEYNDDELTGYAITRGYYDADNKPDTKRAKDDLDIMTAIADRRAVKAVGPVAAGTARDRAVKNTERALSQTFVDGEPIADEKYIRAAFDSLGDEYKADENTSQMLMVVAAGLQALDERRTGRSARGSRSREPVFREGGGGRTRDVGGEDDDALSRAAARARGKTPEQWAKLSKSIGGASIGGTVLEDV